MKGAAAVARVCSPTVTAVRITSSAVAALSLLALLMGCSSGTTRVAAVLVSVPSDGVSLHTRILGHGGQVIVLLHGGPGLSLQEMSPYDALLTASRRLVSFDQRGSGATGRPVSGDFGLAAQVRDVEAVRTFTGSDRIWLIGQSWGGLLAGAYAAAHPDRVAGLVLLDAAPPDLTAFKIGQQAFMDRLAQLQHQGLVPASLPGSASGSCLPALTAELPVYAADPARPPRQPAGITCTAATAQDTFATVIRPVVLRSVAHALAAYHGPALILSGAQDPFGPTWPAAWARFLPKAARQTVADAGHEPVLEQRPVVLRTLERLLAAAP